MERLSNRIRPHLTYANVLATLTAFVVLAGGTAFAASQLAKNSVGTKQLKANAVTTAKIKKNAVTAAKIKAGAVDGTKVKPAGLGAADFQLAGAPYTGIVNKLSANVNALAPAGGGEFEPSVIPLPSLSYTQEAGRIDSYVGALDVTFQPGCMGKRAAIGYLVMDAPPQGPKLDPTIVFYLVAAGTLEDNSGGQATRRINLSSYAGFGTRLAPSSPQAHTFSLLFGGGCESGSGIVAGALALDVIGTKG